MYLCICERVQISSCRRWLLEGRAQREDKGWEAPSTREKRAWGSRWARARRPPFPTGSNCSDPLGSESSGFATSCRSPGRFRLPSYSPLCSQSVGSLFEQISAPLTRPKRTEPPDDTQRRARPSKFPSSPATRPSDVGRKICVIYHVILSASINQSVKWLLK